MSANVYLSAYLAPLSPWLSRPDVTDVLINRPGEVWVETTGGGITREPADEFALQGHRGRLQRHHAHFRRRHRAAGTAGVGILLAAGRDHDSRQGQDDQAGTMHARPHGG